MQSGRRFRSLVVCYHGLSETWSNPLAVRPAAMERQLRSLLFRGFQPARAGDAATGRRRALHVTFDDAFRSIELALPVLERVGVPATVFAATAYAADGRPLDVPEAAELARTFPHEMATMDWDQLTELCARGVEIGSHTVSHPHLRELSDRELRDELVESRQEIEAHLRRPCRFLAYPYGHDDDRVHAAARAAGYEAAFSLASKENPFDAYAIPRVEVYRRDHLMRATLKMSVARRPLRALIGHDSP